MKIQSSHFSAVSPVKIDPTKFGPWSPGCSLHSRHYPALVNERQSGRCVVILYYSIVAACTCQRPGLIGFGELIAIIYSNPIWASKHSKHCLYYWTWAQQQEEKACMPSTRNYAILEPGGGQSMLRSESIHLDTISHWLHPGLKSASQYQSVICWYDREGCSSDAWIKTVRVSVYFYAMPNEGVKTVLFLALGATLLLPFIHFCCH